MLHRELQSQPRPINLELAEILILFSRCFGSALTGRRARPCLATRGSCAPGRLAGVISRLEVAKVP